MLFLLLMIITVVGVFAFLENYMTVRQKMLIYSIIVLSLILYAAVRPVGFDRDSSVYESIFMNPDSQANMLSMEPLFLVICRSLYLVYPDVSILFLFFAIAGVLLNIVAIKRLSPMCFLPLLIYISNFYMVHELTQIRAGVAIGIFMFAIKPISKGEKIVPFVLILIATLFHYSAMALLPAVFLGNKDFGAISKWVWASIVPICLIVYIKDIDVLGSLPIPFVSQKVEAYKLMSEYGSTDKANIINPFTLFRMMVFLYLLYFTNTVKNYVPYVNLIVRMLGCSILIYCFFSSVKVIGTRLSELYSIMEIIAYPCVIYTIRPKYVGIIGVLMVACVYVYFNLFQWQLFTF